VVTDDDMNEAARLDLEDTRETRVDIIGPVGSPDSGFQISSPTFVAGKVDFELAQGTLYLGGLRLHLDEATTYLGQSDFLEIDPIPAPADGRIDLVYIEAWQQHVSAVEDEELFEKALAGPDTSTRLKTMQRVHVAAGVGAGDCGSAFSGVIAGLGSGTLTSECEWKLDSQITVTFDPGGNPADLCNPPVQGGYLGAENQAIRVELLGNNQFTWGFDNASPMYRAQVQNDPKSGQPIVIHLATAPKDQAHWPLAGQAIELLPWGALLPNGEIVADAFGGFLAKVTSSYGPDDQNFVIDAPVPAGFGTAWQGHADAPQLAAGDQYFYMRVWNRGQDLASPAEIGFNPNGVPVPLGDTGLLVQFLGTQFRRSDHWVIAARPQTREVVVPWQLMDKREPHGYQRFLAPLGLIQWSQDPATQALTGEPIDDCRPVFPPLTRARSCCTFTVGDGQTSFGLFSSIQNAIDSLPAEGGEVCVLPGTYTGSIRIVDKQRIRIHGCGWRSVVVPGDKQGDEPLVYIEDSEFIELDRLHLESGEAIAIQSRQSGNGNLIASHLKFEGLSIETAQAAMDLEADNSIAILGNSISLGGGERKLVSAKMAAITVQSTDVLIEGNSISLALSIGRLLAATGGVHIRGGSERVEIRRNHIAGGNGSGITLGSFVEEPADGGQGTILYPGEVLVFDDDGCPIIVVIPPVSGNQPPVIVSEGFLYDFLIHDNRIEQMGGSGIAAAYYIDPNGLDQGVASIIGSTVILIEISNNVIEGCVALEIGDFPPELQNRLGFGGIALQRASDVRIRQNLIRDNGAFHADPICGVFAAVVSGADVEENTIAGNGPAAEANRFSFFGTRGGIVFPELRDTSASTIYAKATTIGRSASLEFAARIHDNTVAAPLGPALFLAATGMVSVIANHFTSYGFVRFSSQSAFDANAQAPPAELERKSVVAGVYTQHISYLSNSTVTSVLLDLLGSAVVVIIDLGSLNTDTTVTYSIAGALLDNGVRGAEIPPSSSGQIQFNDNQVLAQLAANNQPPRFCIVVIGLDDISIANNQSIYQATPTLVTNALVFGRTLRFTGNRLQEPASAATFSALTIGMWNITTHNQSTHCIIVAPVQQTEQSPNQPFACEGKLTGILRALEALVNQ
jgi:hypothetical protein